MVAAVTVLLLATAGTLVLTRVIGGCGEGVVSRPASESGSPFLDGAGQRAQPDRNRDALVRSLGSSGPFGEVVGAVGYHYEQWAQLSAFADGLGVRTRDNPDFTMLDDEDLDPRWSVHVRSRHSAWDADDRTYLVAELKASRPLQLVALDLRTGERQWCAEPGGQVGPDDPFATQLLDDGDVVVLTPEGGDQQVARVSGEDGTGTWRRTVAAGDGDYLGALGEDLLLAGGTPQFELLDPTTLGERDAGTALVALDASSGAVRWRRPAEAGAGVHVVGADPATGTAVVSEWSAQDPSGTLRGLDRTGRQLWSRVPERGAPFDSTLRSGRVLVRSGNRWSAYDARTGELLWRRAVPVRPQFLPYGFELDSMPSLDADHVLLATTAALRVLDLRDGSMEDHAPLPTDGINTTFWPYRVVVTDRLVAVATNTGAVVLRRDHPAA